MLSHQPGDVVVVRGHPYQLVNLMGRGGQGSVFDARDGQGRHVAIKLVPSHPRHRTEAKILASLKSDHVVKLLDAGIARDTLILVLERVEGVDLKALVQLCREEGRAVPPRIAVELIEQACIGLLEATQNARLAFHRDIKPGNLILNRHGVVKLIDFGIAHQQDMAYTGSLIGTPENMAPEQVGLDDEWRVDVRTDLFCLGLVLFELITLETLFRFPPSMPVPERLMVVWHAEVRERLKRVEAVHVALGAFLRKCLQRAPRDRFQTPQEMLAALGRLKDRLPIVTSIDVFAECLYRVAHENERLPMLEQSLPMVVAGPTVSLELGQDRPAPVTAIPSPWWKSLAFRVSAAGLATVLFTVIVLGALVSWMLSSSFIIRPGASERAGHSAAVHTPAQQEAQVPAGN